VEGLHAVGDILTKISVKCVINLHAALLITCLFLWVLCVYVACICLLLFQYEIVHLHNVFVVYILYIIFRKSSVCICFNSMQFEKFTWHSSVGCWVCYSMFHRENKSVLSCIVAWSGRQGTLQWLNFVLLQENGS
jgi:hypothetical protein